MTDTTLKPINLKCEYIENPLGIDTYKPRFSWELVSWRRGIVQMAYRILVSCSWDGIQSGNGEKWDTGWVESDQSSQIAYNGTPLKSSERYFWKVCIRDRDGYCSEFSDVASFETALFKESDWKGVWIGAKEEVSSPYLRKTFLLDREISKARVYVCGLGYYELYLNGRNVGDRVLDPNCTNYDDREMQDLLYPFDDNTGKRVLYAVYDVTQHLKRGKNAMGIHLGNGWYNQRERTVEGKLWFGTPRCILQLNVEYSDGSRVELASDDSWKYSASPVIFNNIFYGEIYDTHLEKDGWTDAVYDDAGWESAKLVKKPCGIMHSQLSPPDKIIDTLSPIKLIGIKPGMHIYDVGRNISGWVRLTVRGRKGSRVVLRFSEELKVDGTLDFESAGGEKQIQKDIYILRGNDIEVYEPHFTWHGFRYIEVTGDMDAFTIINVEGRIVHSAVESTGTFECSNTLINQIQQIYRWTQLNNLHGGVPSDCPHRERLGYTGDGQITAEAAMFNFDMAQFYTKWVRDIGDAQNKKSGFVPHTVPFFGGGGGPAWGSAYIVIPWLLFLNYGDKRILEEHYAGMKHWMKYLETRNDGSRIITREEPGSWCLGDWCTPEKIKLPESLANTFYYGYNARIMSGVADVLGKHEDKVGFYELYESILHDFNKTFLSEDGSHYSIGRQGTEVFALTLNCVPENKIDRVVEHLVSHICDRLEGHLDTGILGTLFLFDVLTDYGYGDLAYSILNKTTFPSYGYMLQNGATTLWENWNGKGSHNHPMFGSISAWFFKKLAGINPTPDDPGFRKVVIKPYPVGDLRFVKASLKTMAGMLKVHWEKSKKSFTMNVSIPVNCSATIYLPKSGVFTSTILESGRVIWNDGNLVNEAEGIVLVQETSERFLVEIVSGSYFFCVK